MTRFLIRFVLLLILVALLFSPAAGFVHQTGSATVTLNLSPGTPTPPPTPGQSELLVIADTGIQNIGYVINGEENVTSIVFLSNANKQFTVGLLGPVPAEKNFTKSYSILGGGSGVISTDSFTIWAHGSSRTIYLYLKLEGDEQTPSEEPSVPPSSGGGGSGGGSGSNPGTVIIPDNPPSDPDTPGSDTPGSDEPYRPILPPAGFVYNIAGFIPLAAGFLLLFLLFAFRGNLVYRILRKQAKKNGHKPEKETLKATAAGVAALIRNEELYPEWRKNSETTARLTADISRVLDETHYPSEIPRGIVVAKIIKAAKGRINRHRL